MEFKQTTFFKPYIKRNTKLQREEENKANEIRKKNAKLRNNTLFGKPMKKVCCKNCNE